MTLAIETHELGYRAGKDFALQAVSMRVPQGAIYGFLGPNGAGKTTTIRLILGLLRPQGGGVSIFGSPMPESYVDVLSRTGYVPDRPHLDPVLSVVESMELHAAFHPRWDPRWAEELRNQFGLGLG